MRTSSLLVAGAALLVSVAGRLLDPASPSLNASDVWNITVDSLVTQEKPSLHVFGTADQRFDVSKAASDALWQRYIAKGHHLNCIMEATDFGAGLLVQDTRNPPSAASLWNADSTILRKWFWHESINFECDFESLTETFQGLGLNTESRYDDDGAAADGHNECLAVTHEDTNDDSDITQQKYNVDGKEYTATSSYFHFAVNVRDGGKSCEYI
jgi:hypothetical protein